MFQIFSVDTLIFLIIHVGNFGAEGISCDSVVASDCGSTSADPDSASFVGAVPVATGITNEITSEGNPSGILSLVTPST